MSCPQSYKQLSLKPSSQNVITLLDYIEQNEGVLRHHSGHGKNDGTKLEGTLTYGLGQSSGIMIALNKNLPSLYIKQFLANGQAIFECVENAKSYLFNSYTVSKRGHLSKGYNTHLDKFDFLNPSTQNPSILLKKVDVKTAKHIIDVLVGNRVIKASVGLPKAERDKATLSPEYLLKKLERQSEIGKKGELFAIEYEKNRLKKSYSNITQTELEQAVKHIAITDVATGYDIESHYNGESRYIEVKTTISKAESDFFFSLNEYEVLKAKGEEAYIYRIFLVEKGSNSEVIKLKDPFGERHPKKLKSVAFKANLNDFEI